MPVNLLPEVSVIHANTMRMKTGVHGIFAPPDSDPDTDCFPAELLKASVVASHPVTSLSICTLIYAYHSR